MENGLNGKPAHEDGGLFSIEVDGLVDTVSRENTQSFDSETPVIGKEHPGFVSVGPTGLSKRVMLLISLIAAVAVVAIAVGAGVGATASGGGGANTVDRYTTTPATSTQSTASTTTTRGEPTSASTTTARVTTEIPTSVSPRTTTTIPTTTTPAPTTTITTSTTTYTTQTTTSTTPPTTTTPDRSDVCSFDGFNPLLFNTEGPSASNLKAFYPRGNPNDEGVNPDVFDVCAARISIIGNQKNATQLKFVGVSRIGNISENISGSTVVVGDICGTSAVYSNASNGTEDIQCMFAKYPQPINTGGKQTDKLNGYPLYYDDDPLYDVVVCTGSPCRIVNVNKALREDFPHNILNDGIMRTSIKIRLTKGMTFKKYGFYCVTNQTYRSVAQTQATSVCKQGMVEPTTEAPTMSTISNMTTVPSHDMQNQSTTSQAPTTQSKELNSTVTESNVRKTNSNVGGYAAEAVKTTTNKQMSVITAESANDMTSVTESNDFQTEISTAHEQMTTVEPESNWLLQLECH